MDFNRLGARQDRQSLIGKRERGRGEQFEKMKYDAGDVDILSIKYSTESS